MKNPLLAATAALLTTVSAVNAAGGPTAYRDDKSGFAITFPAGWVKSQDPLTRQQRIVFQGPHYKEAGESCGVIVADEPATATLTQAQIDADIKSGNELKLEIAQIQQQIPAAKLLSQSIITIDGHAAEQYVMSVPFPMPNGGTVDEVIRNIGISRPGTGYAIDCTARKAKYDALKADFDPVVMSFKITKRTPTPK